MNSLVSMLSNWKTSLAGVAGGLLIVAQSYHSGMTLEQWALAASVTFLGLASADHNVAQPPAK